MSCTFVITSDYLEDLYSYCFVEQDALYTRFMDEFNSRTAQLELKQRVRIRGLLC